MGHSSTSFGLVRVGRIVSVAILVALTSACAVPKLARGDAAQQDPLSWARERLPHTSPGDASRGEAIVTQRQVGLCVLCHAVPQVPSHATGTLGPNLAGVGARLSEPALRARIVDSRRLHAASVMPAYHRTTGLQRVAQGVQGKPLLNAQQVEDVVAYLRGLV